MKKYTKEQLIFYLKKYSKELKKTPTIKDINKNKKVPSSSTYMKRFGSWNNSLKKAGLTINIVKKFEKKELTENEGDTNARLKQKLYQEDWRNSVKFKGNK